MKNKKNLNIFVAMLFSFLMIFLFNNENIKAIEYTYEGGSIKETYKKVDVMAFSYDYITKFEAQTVVDAGIDVSFEKFYSGKSITINYDEYDNLWPFTEDNDGVYIYKHNNVRNDFDSEIKTFKNESGSHTLNEEGLYKVVYMFADEVIYVKYINIDLDMHDVFVKGASKYTNSSAFADFEFTLKLQDAYNLKNNKYYYAFGTSVASLNFKQFEVFEGSDNAVVNELEKDLKVKINETDTSIGGAKKYFFVKIVAPDGLERIVQTLDSYEIASKIQASVLLVDENNNVIDEHVSFKKQSVIKFKIVFNAPVTYSSLQFAVNGINFMPMDDKANEVNEVFVEYVVQDYSNFVGNFKLQTKNNVSAVVKNAGVNIALDVVVKASFDIDVVNPEINVIEDGEVDGSKKYAITVEVTEDNLKDVQYYAKVCTISQEDRCLDKFDVDNPNIVSLGAANNPTAVIDDKFGKYDGVNLALFVRAVDKAGNVKTFVKWGYVIDNVIVADGESNALFVNENIVENDSIKGKKLIIKVPVAYNVTAVSYKPLGSEENACQLVASADANFHNYECLKIEGYDFNSKVSIILVDSLGNKETHATKFKYSTIIDGNIVLGGKNFSLYSDEDYEIEFKSYNSMKENEVRLEFNQEILDGFKNELNLDKIPTMQNLTIRLVYLNDEEVIVLNDNVGNNIEIPTVLEILEILGNLEKFKTCAMDKCDVELYLQYDYVSNNIPQTRLVKINFIDNSNKYSIDNFNYENKVNVGEQFVEFNYKYLDNLNKNIDAANIVSKRKIMFEDVTGNIKEVTVINTSVLGKYTVTESFEYNTVNSFPLNYIVEIVDTVAPVIRLNGKEKIELVVGDEFVDPMAVANDNYDDHVIVQFKVDPELDVNKPGTYVISYWAVDSSGNISEIVTRTIVVKGESQLTTYLIAGGIGLFTVLVMVVGTIIEVKKEKRRK